MLLRRFWVMLSVFCVSSLLWCGLLVSPAQAAIHTYPETDDQMMYRSRLSLRDDQGLAWQTIVFKRVREGQVLDFKLRLVGFPGQVAVAHPADVVLRQGMNDVWQATDETEQDGQLNTVVSSVGQYDLFGVMRSLDRSAPMVLDLMLEGGEMRSLVVPPYVVKEWLALKEMPH